MFAVMAGVVGFNAFASLFAHPEWATPINTALLIVVTVVNWRLHRGVQTVNTKVDSVHVDVAHAANAAAAAAASAADVARITKELGGHARRTELPPPIAP